MIKLINSVGAVLNRDPATRDQLRVLFMPNFNVSNGLAIYPAADLSEQISTAGKEASGTGNMKFAMNGALTIGTLDGANVELRDEVGADNFFLFGMTAPEVVELRAAGYSPADWCSGDPELAAAVELVRSGFFSRGDTELFEPLLRGLLDYDPYLRLRRLRRLPRLPTARGRCVCRPRPLDAHVDCERGAHRQILLRPDDPRVLLRHLAYPVRADQTQLRRVPRLG